MIGFYLPYWWLILPAILLGVWAQSVVRNTFARYSEVRTRITGAEMARTILDENGLRDVPIERVGGTLSDHYDPKERVLRLSEPVYGQATVAAIGVAAHESGHAIQHARSYLPLAARSLLYPVASFGSNLGPILVIGGLLLGAFHALITVGIVLFAAAVAFSVITLPVEFNASSRALKILRGTPGLSRQDVDGARKVLTAAALTYVASALASVLTLLRLILLSRRS